MNGSKCLEHFVGLRISLLVFVVFNIPKVYNRCDFLFVYLCERFFRCDIISFGIFARDTFNFFRSFLWLLLLVGLENLNARIRIIVALLVPNSQLAEWKVDKSAVTHVEVKVLVIVLSFDIANIFDVL